MKPQRKTTTIARKKKEECKHSLNICKAAKCYKKFSDAKSNISTLEKKLEQTSESDEYSQMNAFGAAVKAALSKCIPIREEEKSQTDLKSKSTEEELEKQKTCFETAKKELENAKRDEGIKSGGFDEYKKETDKLADKLGADLIRDLTGQYSIDYLDKFINETKAQNDTILENINSLSNDLASKQNVLEEIPKKQADITVSKKDYESLLSTANSELDKYNEIEKKLKKIFDSYEIDFEKRFTSVAADYISQQLETQKINLRNAQIELERKEEEIELAESGQLHISPAVTKWLNQTNVHFQTCEKYLIKQIEIGNCTKEQVAEILNDCPEIAYGILLTKDEAQQLCSLNRPEWLPSILPFFTMDEMKDIIAGKRHGTASLIAYYSKEIFSDPQHFKSLRIKERTKLSERVTMLEDRITTFENELNTIKEFSYDEDWRSKKDTEISDINRSIENCKDEYDKLEDEKDNLKRECEDIRTRIKTLETQNSETKDKLKDADDFRKRLNEEKEKSIDLENAQKTTVHCSKKFNSAEAKLDELKELDEKLKRDLKQITDNLTEMQNVKDEVENCESAKHIEGEWNELYVQFRQLRDSLGQSKEVIKVQLEYEEKNRDDAKKQLDEIGCKPGEYENVTYSEDEHNHLKSKLDKLNKELDSKDKNQRSAAEKMARLEGEFNGANKNIQKYGQPFEKQEITGNFDEREGKANKELQLTDSELKNATKEKTKLNTLQSESKLALKPLTNLKPENSKEIPLNDDYTGRWECLWADYNELKNKLDESHMDEQNKLDELIKNYEGTPQCETLNAMSKLLKKQDAQHDAYFTLSELIESGIKTTELRIGKIESDLTDFGNTRRDLIHQCLLQGKNIYNGLKNMVRNSKIRAYENIYKNMLKLDLCDEIDDKVAELRIANELERSVKELASKKTESKIEDSKLTEEIKKAMSSQKLLRQYIGTEHIGLEVYKLDSNPQNAGYRRWESAKTDNSGAEKFLMYFSIILSVIYDIKSDKMQNNQKQTDVLILDNPFSTIHSEHALKPMFNMAKRFNIQLICLSDITKCDITSRFDLHIKAVIKDNSLSNTDILSHEGNEIIEHGFYRAVQTKLSDI